MTGPDPAVVERAHAKARWTVLLLALLIAFAVLVTLLVLPAL